MYGVDDMVVFVVLLCVCEHLNFYSYSYCCFFGESSHCFSGLCVCVCVFSTCFALAIDLII